MCSTVREGVNIGFTGPNTKIISKNWPSAIELSEHVDKFVFSNLEKGRIEGPLGQEEQLPSNFRSSPLGAFYKKNGIDVRVIHDLSHPKHDSVNSGITIDTAVEYSTVLDAVKLLSKYKDPYMAKLDLRSAYQSVLVRPEDQNLEGFSWEDKNGVRQFFKMKVLSFGLSSAPRQFKKNS